MLPDNELDIISRTYNEEIGFEKTILKYKMLSITPYLYGKSLLDLGCGVGFFCNSFSNKFNIIVGVDGSHKKILKATSLNKHPHISFIEAMFDKLNISYAFDTIIVTNVLEHVQNAIDFLAWIKKLLSESGRIIITVPNALGLHKRIGKHLGIIPDYYALTDADRAKGHKRIYDRATLSSDVQSAGFSIIATEGIFLKPLSHKQMESWDSSVCDALYEIGKQLPDYCSSILLVAKKIP